MRKLKNVWFFFASTVLLNLGISLAAAIFGGIAGFAGSFLFFGFAFSLAVKEVRAKNEYVFYRNNGLSRAQLWVSSFVINFTVYLLLITILVVCQDIFSK
ncbi:MAG: hypothetical protein EOO50_02875 [Flavobacterium sp.]|uniref:hypothetical protein n=1 Tax=Flavobacterium sp. TaxID=239 RepID=UPI00122AABA3|nr:hypothetical protein [Flavobacterium sp.]RZJ68047.1 MAG: hypothetical protein EOO50_02875 [Flavobacterium sp.]